MPRLLPHLDAWQAGDWRPNRRCEVSNMLPPALPRENPRNPLLLNGSAKTRQHRYFTWLLPSAPSELVDGVALVHRGAIAKS